ncbi:MAG TPA: glycosyltransferase N-terminal domain-containing protein, partial [Flavobacterium sp.]|nr:glycosyltransferase N-terminal domain-containing protein [Flavobacterium sp.]
MQLLYNLFIRLTAFFLPVTTFFSGKMKSFVNGRKYIWDYLEQEINPEEQYIWFHVSSLGEYEQGVPMMQEIRKNFPEHKILLSFFSPSGYEIRKNNPLADITIYLPLDTPKNAKKFIQLVQPKMAFFVKYDFWPNYLHQLKNKEIPTYLVSGIFREKQLFFKKYGKFYRKSLQAFEHFFVQDDNSQQLLQSIGYTNVTVAGDTRFDRVYEITKNNANLPDIENFIQDKLCIVFGSTWAKDDELIASFINQNKQDIKYLIAPHDIKEKNIARLESLLKKKSVRYTKSTTTEIKNSDV